MNKFIFSLIQFFPLSLFATFAFWNGLPTIHRWLDAFVFGAILGLLQFAILILQKRPLNRLILAGNLYLILGGLAVLSKQWWYLEIYDSFRESGIILFMSIVGIISTLFSSHGFIAVENSPKKLSVYLFVATLTMLPISVLFEGNRTYAAVIPIIFLAIVQRVLIFKAR